MAFDYINEAFKRLNTLEEEMFNSSSDGINRLNDFMTDGDNDIDTVRVIDTNATEESDLEDSYVGKVIINCNVCHSHIFEDKDEIEIDEDGAVNVETQCPYCGESEGFMIIGEIAPFNSEEEIPEEDSTEDAPTEETSKEEDSLDEALGIGAGLALGGAAIGAGMVGSKLLDDVQDPDEDELLAEGLIGDINVNVPVDGSNSSVGFLGGTASTTNEDVDDVNQSVSTSRARRRSVMTEETSNKEKLIAAFPDVHFNFADSSVMNEDFKEVSIKTEDQKLEMSSDENGKVTVVTEPISNDADVLSGEAIVPVTDETQEEILANNDIDDIEEFDEYSEDEITDMSVDEADEEGLDELGESYFKRVYENVNSFKTTSVSCTPTHMIVEGVIGFNSGAKKKTGFIFEAKDINSSGKVRFVGTNKQLTESTDAFSLVGRIDNKKLFVESLKYNYSIADNSVRGLIRRK